MTTNGFFGWFVVTLLVIVGIVQVAIVRDRSIVLSRHATSGRMLIAAGSLEQAGRFGFLLWPDFVLEVPWHSTAAIALIALGTIAASLDRLLKTPDPQPPTTLENTP